MPKVLIIGASRGIGLETVKAALGGGHKVRALSRSAADIPIENADLEKLSGNALESDTIRNALEGVDVKIGSVLHPSPASPKANRGWAAEAEKQLAALQISVP